MTSYDGQSITYDAIGNPLSYYNGQRYTMTWSNGRQLDSTNVGGMNLSYSYNADGQRTSKSRSAYYTDEYVYYGTQLSTLIRNGVGYKHSLTFIYDDNGQALGFYYDTNLNDSNPGTKYYYVCNAQGDVLQLRDHTNAPVANYYYDSWGKLLGITDANGNAITAFNSVAVLNPIRYRGYFYDTETGFYYLNSRYYDPEIGRFINADAMIKAPGLNALSTNMFTYCANNPILYSDSTGQWFLFDDLIAGAVGLVVGVTSQFVGDVVHSVSQGKWEFSSWETYVGSGVGGAVGGITAIYAGPVAGAAVGAGTSTLVGQTLENLTGRNKRSTSEILTNTAIDATIGGLTSKFLPVNVPGITKGRNSMSAVYQSGLTKIKNETAKKMSPKVIGKGVISGVVSDFSATASIEIKDLILTPYTQSYSENNVAQNGALYWCEP